MTPQFVFALYSDEAEAAIAVRNLVEAGFPLRAISVLMHEPGEEVENIRIEPRTKAARGAAIGAALGAAGGALATAGVGLLAAGPLLGLVQAVVAGGGLGSLMGAAAGLAGSDDAHLPVREIGEGSILVGVTADQPRGVERAKLNLQEAQPQHAPQVVLERELTASQLP